jgi:hypothetical protein
VAAWHVSKPGRGRACSKEVGKNELSMNFLCGKSFVQHTSQQVDVSYPQKQGRVFLLSEICINISENFPIFLVSLDFKM